MKGKALVLIFLFFTVTVIKSFSQMESNDLKKNDSLLMNSFKRHLKGAMVLNSVINCLEITGTPFFAAGVIKNSDVMAIGFLIGFPGMEMSKYTPMSHHQHLRPFDLPLLYFDNCLVGVFKRIDLHFRFQ